MTHLTIALLEGYALHTLSETEFLQVEEHLQLCEECTARLAELTRLPDALADVEPAIPAPAVPYPTMRSQTLTVWMRIAAALVFGFATGLIAARQTCGPSVLVMGDFAVSRGAQTVTLKPVTCAVVDLVGLLDEQ
ncbi:MAG: hypothetical protein ISR91_06590 [Candidatus Delongbacteria bacterium]|nr:hypothetical protein [bacterium]MBL7033796.1 hypothetical protein [Candidatus Delongbacteria bacterium]